jgi:hypothetical protein
MSGCDYMKKSKIVFGVFAAAICTTIIYLVILQFLALSAVDTFNGTHFTFMIPADLSSANGWAWTLTISLTLFYWVAGAFLVMEGKMAKGDVQKKFHYHLAFMLILLGIAQGIVALYSILTEPISTNGSITVIPPLFPGIEQLLPGTEPFERGDGLFALAIACSSSILIIHSIEKYIKNSKKFVLTTLVTIGACSGLGSIILAYVNKAGLLPAEDWVKYLGYGLVGFMIVGMVITIFALPIIYFTLAHQTSGDLKKNSLTIAWGFLITFVMVLLHLLRSILGDIPLGWMIFIAGNIIGTLILLSGYMRSTF